jgi:YCII-related domain
MKSKNFFYRLIPPRPDFPFTMDPDEQSMMKDHSSYWDCELSKGNAVALGPVLSESGAFGIGILCADSHEEAEGLVKSDPAISRKMGFTYELSPMLGLKRADR